MASLVDNYEQQYAVLTADITAKIGRIRIQSGGEKRAFVQDVDRQIEEAQELLEQMELEVRGMNGIARDRLRGRVESHRAELKRLTQEFQTAKKPKEDITEITVEESWDNNVTEDQRKRLLDASERIERSGRTLQNGYRMALETEEIGSEVLKELHEQRETIQRSRGRLRETDAELGRGSRLLSGMIFRSLQQRIILAGVALVLIIVACIVIYYSFKS
ncbi:PREDICTED: vesicle transport through interaction with t-SNAREs homolog 1A isoform X2 [Cyphomyrmex costatus]|uniref:Vesicle transport through interaction with t-SNAREs homolog 1A n=1 Tax=Cyphomyrmex costatus TaxID=456900 RepID=A0A195CS93_9HYME|nr:PREDICTED: vesicle transport through interaction with t-SNAREs homolog 1A isoform X2 [Cyphomyrmex costatus]KYN03515.1 Vesicle transport through interaction with t-SNAREs like protein 1A [Cyphomyrmex costatus]